MVKHYEKVCCSQNIVPTTKVKVIIEGQRFVTYKWYVSHNSKTNKGDLIILHRRIKKNEKVCHVQNLVSNDPGQGHI